MSKYIGLAIAFAFFATWVYRKLRHLRHFKGGELKSIPTGVSRWTYLLVLILILVGGIALPISVGQLVAEFDRQQSWVKATGFVTEHVASGTYRGRPTYQTRFHFQTSLAQASEDHAVIDPAKSEKPPAVSSSIKVLYDPSNPRRAVIDSFQKRWLMPILLCAVSLICLWFSLGAIVRIVKLQSLAKLRIIGPHAGLGHGRLLRSEKNFFLSLRNKPSWSLVVEYTDLANRHYLARSEPFWDFHPDAWTNESILVPLSIDRQDPAKAWVRLQDYFLLCRSNTK